MDFRFNRVCISVLVLMVTSAVLSEDVKNETAEVKDDILKDCAAENSIREMLAKLEYELARRSFCSTEEEDPTYIPRTCIDVASDQSVLSQVCDRITSLDIQVNKLASKINPFHSNHNSEDDELSKPYTQIRYLREEIKKLQRSSVFYGTRKEKIGNFTHMKLVNYMTTVNTGTFDAVHGIFQCPFDGVYHFSLSYEKVPDGSLEALLLVDDVVIASSSQQLQPKIDVLTSLTTDQKVTTNLTNINISPDSEVLVTFSGFFVH